MSPSASPSARASFDLIARNDGTLLVIKVVSHIDSVSEEAAFDLELISRLLGGIPLIVGERARDAELERGAVYVRYGIYAVSPSTLYDYFVEKIPPLVYASPGGLYVNIDGDALKDIREKRNMSLGDLGNVLGVSRRTISKYESGIGTTLDVAIRIEEFFNHRGCRIDRSHQARVAQGDGGRENKFIPPEPYGVP